MARFFQRRFSRSGLHPVNRIKHVHDRQYAQIVGNTTTQQIAKAVASPDPLLSEEVEVGSTINGFFIILEANATSSAALANFYMYLAKNPGANLSLPAANVVGSDDNKRFVIHQEMVMFQQQTNSNPRTVFKGVIVVPRGYRRMAPNDRWDLVTTSPGVSVNVYLQVHYKEFR